MTEGDAVLLHVGGGKLDPPELEFMAESGIASGAAGVDGALAGTAGVYVAFDADVVDPPELDVFMPEPDGLRLEQAESLFRQLAERAPVLGLGFSGLRYSERNVEPLARLAGALGL